MSNYVKVEGPHKPQFRSVTIAPKAASRPCDWPGCVNGDLHRADGTWGTCNCCGGTGWIGKKPKIQDIDEDE